MSVRNIRQAASVGIATLALIGVSSVSAASASAPPNPRTGYTRLCSEPAPQDPAATPLHGLCLYTVDGRVFVQAQVTPVTDSYEQLYQIQYFQAPSTKTIVGPPTDWIKQHTGHGWEIDIWHPAGAPNLCIGLDGANLVTFGCPNSYNTKYLAEWLKTHRLYDWLWRNGSRAFALELVPAGEAHTGVSQSIPPVISLSAKPGKRTQAVIKLVGATGYMQDIWRA